MPDLEKILERAQRRLEPDNGFDRDAELLLNDASDYFAGTLAEADPRAWQHLLIDAPTSVLGRALWRRLTNRFTHRWRN